MTRDSDNQRLLCALEAMDQANAQDPRHSLDAQGQAHPTELLYARRMSDELAAFCPQASEALQLAARAQHIERWRIPRQDYPMDRAGYLAWRTALKAMHAQRAGEILAQAGYESPMIDKVGALLRKEQMKRDPECQTLGDVVCLVFLRYYLDEFAQGKSEDKLIDILQKTWRKMSSAGHAAALALPFTAEQQALLHKALG